MKYYAVEAKCGHVGRNNCIIITFPIIAENGKAAAKATRKMGRVKHDRKDAILGVKEITVEEYNELYIKNMNDPYLQARNKQEQNKNCINLSERVIEDRPYRIAIDKKTRAERIAYVLKKQKILERFNNKSIKECY